MEQRKYEEAIQRAEDLRSVWKVPLFIVGAGVSYGRVPTMRQIFDYFCREGMLPDELRQHGMRLLNPHYQSRATASHFFGTLQTSRNEPIRKAWARFTVDFINGSLVTDRSLAPLWSISHSRFHRDIASQVVRKYLPGICLSLNYDGLTAKAIREASQSIASQPEVSSSDTDVLYPCRILTTADEIETFFGRSSDSDSFYPLVKLRGDIFNAVCGTEGCRYFNMPIPVYEIPVAKTSSSVIEAEIGHSGTRPLTTIPSSADDTFDRVMTCRGCGRVRRIEIDFPGYRTKELQTLNTITALIRYVVPSVSLIFVCGVSGTWDADLVEFVGICGSQHGIPIYVLDNIKQPPFQLQLANRADSRLDLTKDTLTALDFDFKTYDEETK